MNITMFINRIKGLLLEQCEQCLFPAATERNLNRIIYQSILPMKVQEIDDT